MSPGRLPGAVSGKDGFKCITNILFLINNYRFYAAYTFQKFIKNFSNSSLPEVSRKGIAMNPVVFSHTRHCFSV
jgi:hypothetical protein